MGWDFLVSIRREPKVTLDWIILTKSKDRAGHPGRTFQVPKDWRVPTLEQYWTILKMDMDGALGIGSMPVVHDHLVSELPLDMPVILQTRPRDYYSNWRTPSEAATVLEHLVASIPLPLAKWQTLATRVDTHAVV